MLYWNWAFVTQKTLTRKWIVFHFWYHYHLRLWNSIWVQTLSFAHLETSSDSSLTWFYIEKKTEQSRDQKSPLKVYNSFTWALSRILGFTQCIIASSFVLGAFANSFDSVITVASCSKSSCSFDTVSTSGWPTGPGVIITILFQTTDWKETE